MKGPGTPATPAIKAVTPPRGMNPQSFILKWRAAGNCLLITITKMNIPNMRSIVEGSNEINNLVPRMVSGIAPTRK